MLKWMLFFLCLSGVSFVSALEASECAPLSKPGLLRLGSRSSSVLVLQKILNSDPDTVISVSGAGSPGHETVQFGTKTVAAVKKFQEKYSSEVLAPAGMRRPTGQVGAMTKKKLQSLCLGKGVATSGAVVTVSDDGFGLMTSREDKALATTSKSLLTQASYGISQKQSSVATSSPTTQGVKNTPAVSNGPYIASPQSGEVYRSHFTISIVVAAQEPSSKVVLFVDSKPLKSQSVTGSNQRIFVFSMDAYTLNFGTHTLSAQVTSLRGKLAKTPSVSIEIARTGAASSGGVGGGAGGAGPVLVDGECGTLHNSFIGAELPADGFCKNGSLGAVTGSGPWEWTCVGENGGQTAQCSANIASAAPAAPSTALVPSCGSSNGVSYISKPSLDLCATGEASLVTGTGPFSWTCSTGAQTSVSCQSPKIVPSGTTYYLSDCQIGAAPGCVAGTSTNTGLSALSPKRVYAELPALKKGDTVKFAKGGSWTNATMRFRANPATREDPFVFDSYDTSWGGSQKPILTGATVFNFDDAAALDATGAPLNDGGYVIRNLTLRGGTTFQNPAGGGNGVFISRRVHDVTMENLDISGFSTGVFSTTIDNTNITLRNSIIHDNTKSGWLGGGVNVVIEDTVFDRNGSQPVFDHNLYMSYVDKAIIRGNILTRNTLNAAGSCVGTIFVVHGTAANMLIENNYLYEENAGPGCYGIEISPGYAASVGMESFSNNTIRNNNVVNVGYVGIGARNCFNCTIENNNIAWTKNTGMIGISMGVNVPGVEDDQRSKLIIRNNSIYTNSSAMTSGMAMLPLGGDHVISSNMIYLGANTPPATVKCFDMGTSTRAFYREFDNNACYRQGTSPLYSNTYSSSSVARDNNFDVHGLTIDPLLIAVPNASSTYLIRTSSQSVLVNAGNTLFSSMKDYFNSTRDSLPDIGAFEALP